MASLISDTEKSNLTGIFLDIFDTFARDIAVYKKPKRNSAAIDTAFIFGYDQGSWNNSYTYTYSGCSGIYPAVVTYDKGLDDIEQHGLAVDQDVVKGVIKVKNDCKTFIEDGRPVERLVVDGKNFKVVGESRLQAFLNSKFYVFNIERLK